MPDLATRTERERQIATALVLLFGQWEDRPWDASAFRSDAQRVLSPVLAGTFADSAGQFLVSHPVAGFDPTTMGQRWAAGFSGELSAEMAASTPGLGAGAFSAGRAETIAVTEVTRAATAAEAAIAAALVLIPSEEGGGEMLPVWYTSLDERVCPVCAPLHGTGESVWGPVSPGGPPAHPHCRCWLTWE